MRSRRRSRFVKYWSDYFREVRLRSRERRKRFSRRFRYFIARPFTILWRPIGNRLRFMQDQRVESQKNRRAWFYFTRSRLRQWLFQPRLFHLIKGLPALAVVGLLLSAFISSRADISSRAQAYQRMAKTALAENNFDLANVAYERLATDFPNLPEYRFGLAMTALAQKDTERGEALIEEIAPLDRPGYQQAHLFLANKNIQLMGKNAEPFALAEKHLLRAIQSKGDPALAQVMLGQLYMVNNRFVLAERNLKEAEATHPEASLILARLYDQQKRTELSRASAIRAREQYVVRLREEPDNPVLRMALCDANNILGRFAESVEILRAGMERSDSPELRYMLGKTLAMWVDDPKVSLNERLALIDRGLSLVPDSPTFFEKLLKITRMEGEAGGKARQQLERILANGGKNLSTFYLILGTDADRQKQPDKARDYLEKAYQLAPQKPMIANNLAWVISNGEKPDLPRALSLANQAVKLDSREIQYRDTRGQILAKMGRWKEALEDLEICVTAIPNNPGVHKTLAEIYGKLNMPEPAKAHERLAISLEARRKP